MNKLIFIWRTMCNVQCISDNINVFNLIIEIFSIPKKKISNFCFVQ